jgi:hypothetical protein
MNEETIGVEATKEIAKTGRAAMESVGKLARYFDGMLRKRAGIAEDTVCSECSAERRRVYEVEP